MQGISASTNAPVPSPLAPPRSGPRPHARRIAGPSASQPPRDYSKCSPDELCKLLAEKDIEVQQLRDAVQQLESRSGSSASTQALEQELSQERSRLRDAQAEIGRLKQQLQEETNKRELAEAELQSGVASGNEGDAQLAVSRARGDSIFSWALSRPMSIMIGIMMLLTVIGVALDVDTRELHVSPLSWGELGQLAGELVTRTGQDVVAVLPEEVLMLLPRDIHEVIDLRAFFEMVGWTW